VEVERRSDGYGAAADPEVGLEERAVLAVDPDGGGNDDLLLIGGSLAGPHQ
jgi:hypothetical protein